MKYRRHHKDEAEKKEVSIGPQPSLGQIREWAAQDVTKYVLKVLNQHFPDYRQDMPIRSADHAYLVNYRAGNREVIEALARLIENGEV